MNNLKINSHHPWSIQIFLHLFSDIFSLDKIIIIGTLKQRHFLTQDLWEIIEHGFISPTYTFTLITTQRKVLYIFLQQVVDAIFSRIMDNTSDKET